MARKKNGLAREKNGVAREKKEHRVVKGEEVVRKRTRKRELAKVRQKER